MSESRNGIRVEDTEGKDEMDFEEGDSLYSNLNKLNADLMERNYSLMMEKAELERTLSEQIKEKRKLKKRVNKLLSKIKKFRTPPFVVGEIIEKLGDGRMVVKNGVGHYYVVKNLAEEAEEDDFTIGNRVMMDYKNLNVVEPLHSTKDPIVSGAQLIERPEVTYDEIGGLEDQIVEIQEMVELPLTKPELYERVGVEPPKGVLLVGPPGNGKTLLARAVANKTRAVFIRLVGSELVQKYIGEGSRLVRELFQLAKEKAPSIIFIDEIDAIGARRLGTNTSGDREVQRTLMQLLSEMDGFKPLNHVSMIAATNRPDILDRALMRPGRFDRIIEIPPPGKQAVKEILKIHSKKLNLDWRTKRKLDDFARKCEDFSGAELRKVCIEAGMHTIRADGKRITVGHFEKAIEKVKEKIEEKDSLESSPEKRKIYQ